MFNLAGKTALITGASGGLGGAIARALHARGAIVALSGTRRDALETLAADLKDRTLIAPCDLSNVDSLEALVPTTEAALGSVDILVNNAGVTRDNLFMRMKDAEWDTVLAIDLTAAFRLSRAALKNMMKRRYGRIINITSIVGVKGNPGQSNYAAAKAGLIGMSEVARGGGSLSRDHRQLYSARLHRQSDDGFVERQAARLDSRVGADGPARRRFRRRLRRCLFGKYGSVVHHRTDASRQWRNGNDLRGLRIQGNPGSARGRPPRLSEEDMLSTAFVARHQGFRAGNSSVGAVGICARPGLHR